jgi:hypothetical protein
MGDNANKIDLTLKPLFHGYVPSARLLRKRSGTDILHYIKKQGLRRDKNAGTKPNSF